MTMKVMTMVTMTMMATMAMEAVMMAVAAAVVTIMTTTLTTVIPHPHCLAASDRPPQPSRAGFQPSVQLGDISSFDLVDGENLFFLLEKRTGNSSSKQHPPVTLLSDT